MLYLYDLHACMHYMVEFECNNSIIINTLVSCDEGLNQDSLCLEIDSFSCP